MKRYIQYFFVAASALLLASCGKIAPSKAEVEAGFAAPTALPTLTISGDAVCDAVEGTVSVPVTVSGLPSNVEGFSVGLMTSRDPSFKESKYVPAENAADGTVTMVGTVTPNSTWYVKAVAASPTGGYVATEAISVAVPDVPLWVKAPGTYAAKVVSEAYDDEYENTIYVVADEEDPQHVVWIGGIEPYYASKGQTGEKLESNYVKATVDEKNGCLVVANGADIHYGGRSLAGLNDTSMEAATKYAPITFKMQKDGNLYRFEAFMTITPSGEPEDAYFGDVVYKAK